MEMYCIFFTVYTFFDRKKIPSDVKHSTECVQMKIRWWTTSWVELKITKYTDDVKPSKLMESPIERLDELVRVFYQICGND